MDTAIHLFAITMEPETRTLARGLRRRDPGLLESLIARYEYRLYRYLLYLTGSTETARDLFQETWLRVLARGHQYDGVSRFEPWLFSIARHLAIDASRRKGADSLEELLDPAAGGRAREPRAPDGTIPFNAYASRELEARLGSVLGRLPAIHREVLLLRFQEDLSLEEIAGVVRAPLSTVKSRLYRGLRAARDLLEEQQS
ncbi:MAG: sigma-70 family RNA polymerase sigma factor [Acidobacteria bacterium]|nr:sigma-70 family RNA polymerase sigma factor [Acidobacteriota bacterium]